MRKMKVVPALRMVERAVLLEVVKKLKGTGQKVRRAQILLKADVQGPGWTDRHSGRGVQLPHQDPWRTFASIWSRGVLTRPSYGIKRYRPRRFPGCWTASKRPGSSPLASGPPPPGLSPNWTLRLLARKVALSRRPLPQTPSTI